MNVANPAKNENEGNFLIIAEGTDLNVNLWMKPAPKKQYHQSGHQGSQGGHQNYGGQGGHQNYQGGQGQGGYHGGNQSYKPNYRKKGY
jgi:hypothetical protein